jgi:SMC interacting uncharacterized protein involved in chromosome segregation
MEDQAFEVLEQKINQMLSLMSRLRRENEQLRQENQKLKDLIDEKEKTVQKFKTEIERFRSMKSEVNTYKESQDHIRAKVETLLEKLKEFENIK